MTDFEKAKDEIVKMLFTADKHAYQELLDILARNQNPGSGGDDSFTEEKWTQLRDFLGTIRQLYQQYNAFME